MPLQVLSVRVPRESDNTPEQTAKLLALTTSDTIYLLHAQANFRHICR